MSYQQQLERIKNDTGFIAALDQSGGSTPKALQLYGVKNTDYNNDEEMFAQVHEMRSRIITCNCFDNKRVLGAILFENTIDRQIEGEPTATYLWQEKNIVPFLKVDKGLAEKIDGVQMMKNIVNLDELLDKAKTYPIFGTKMRSVIHEANAEGIKKVVQQQFDIAKQILEKGFMPIVEPEVNIQSSDKAESEILLKQEILQQLEKLTDNQQIMLKLSLPEQANFYQELVHHNNVLKVVALSGGYSQDEACKKLSQNSGMIASFSRAFTEGLQKQQSDAEFAEIMDSSIEKIYQASKN